MKTEKGEKMLQTINWDIIFAWKIWQIMKWVTGIIIILLLLISIWIIESQKEELNTITTKEFHKEWDITVIKKIVFGTRKGDKELIQLIRNYRKERGINE